MFSYDSSRRESGMRRHCMQAMLGKGRTVYNLNLQSIINFMHYYFSSLLDMYTVLFASV